MTPGTVLRYENGSHASLSEMILPPFPWILPQILPPFFLKNVENLALKITPYFKETWRSFQEVNLSDVSFHMLLISVTLLISQVGSHLQMSRRKICSTEIVKYQR